jgi:hypothetical protein
LLGESFRDGALMVRIRRELKSKSKLRFGGARRLVK